MLTDSCTLILAGDLDKADHDCYCSGNECEDTIEPHSRSVFLTCSTKTIGHLKYLETMGMLNEIFNPDIGFNYVSDHEATENRGSYFCDEAPSGRKHEQTFTAKYITNILDDKCDPNLLHMIRSRLQAGPKPYYYTIATINEDALDQFVTALQTE